MAGPDSGWETVTHKKKPTVDDKKAARKSFKQNAAVVEDFAPLDLEDTSFTAAFNKNKQNQGASRAKDNIPKKKKEGGKKKPEGPVTLEDALKSLSVEDVTNQWEDVKVRCESAPSLWLGDIVGFLTRRLDVKDPEPFQDEAPDYPCSVLDSEMRSFLASTLGSYQTKMLKEFFDYCLKEMLSDLKKGQPVHAYRIYLQLLVKRNPAFITNSFSQYRELIKKRQNERLPCLALLWLCDLAGLTNPVTGLQVWSEVMQPMMTHKVVGPYAVSSLERILSGKMDKRKANAVFGPTKFFPLLDVIFTSAGLPQSLQKSLLKLYPKLQTIAFGTDPSTSLRKFFPSYLTRLTPECPDNYKAELLEGLVHCLSTDSRCLSEWRQMYDTHLVQSGILLRHIMDTWTESASLLPQESFHETIRAFHLTNEELPKKHRDRKNIERCQVPCKFLLEQIEKKKFPWRPVGIGLMVILITALIADVVVNGGFASSTTYRLMERSGLINILKQAWSKIALYAGIAFRWLSTNVPVYYAKACELCGPYLTLMAQKLVVLGAKLLELMDPAIVWLQTNIPIALHWIEGKVPIVLAAVEYHITAVLAYTTTIINSVLVVVMPYITEAWEAISFYGLIFWESVEPALSSSWLWLKASVGTT